MKYGNGILVIRMGSDKASATAMGVDGLTLQNNEIYNNEKNGIYLGPINSNYAISGNYIYDNGYDGLRVDLTEEYYGGTAPVYDQVSGIVAGDNQIYGNALYNVQMIGAPTNGFILDAGDNWWGRYGPGHRGCRHHGQCGLYAVAQYSQ